MSTIKIGPIEANATRPKESDVDLFPARDVAIPTPTARINGTVIGPVVTPPLSKDSGI